MKAYELMMFFLIFNVCVSLVNALDIFDTGVNTDTTYEYDPDEITDTSDEETGVWWQFLGTTMLSLGTGAIAGALIGVVFLKIPADSGAAYGAFSGVFWSMAISSFAIIWSIGSIPGGGTNLGIMIIVFLFAGLTGVIFFVGLLQLIRGPWKGMV
jgi:hypothetical protein